MFFRKDTFKTENILKLTRFPARNCSFQGVILTPL